MEQYLPVDYLYLFISFTLTTFGTVRAGLQDSQNIFSRQTTNYMLLTGGLIFLIVEYIYHTNLALMNIISLAVFSSAVSLHSAMTSRRLLGNTDIIFTHLYLLATPPILLNGFIIPYSLLTVASALVIAIYQIYLKDSPGLPFLSILAYSHIALSTVFIYSLIVH